MRFTYAIIPKKNAHRIGHAKDGRAYQYRKQTAIDSEYNVWWEARQQFNKLPVRRARGPVRVEAVYRKTQADCIGLQETVLDGLQGIVYEDDAQVVEQSSRWEREGELPAGVTAIVACTILEPGVVS